MKPNIILKLLNATFFENIEEGGTKMDPYIKFKIGKIEFKTQVEMKSGTQPTFNFTKELHIANLDQDLHIEVWEWDRNSADDFLAQAKINLEAALGHQGNVFALEVIRKGKAYGFLNMQILEIDTNPNNYLSNANALSLKNYLDETGLHKAFQIIFAEILNKQIKEDKVYTYTALRLRRIGQDLQVMRQKSKSTHF